MKKIICPILAVLLLSLFFFVPLIANAAAQFKVSDLSISPTYITANAENGNINISVKVTNSGTEKGTYKLELNINDKLELTKDISLDSGKEQTVVIPVTKQNPGEYSVTIGDLKGTFSVGPEGLEIKTLIIDPIEARPDEEINISATVQNKLSDKSLKYDSLKLYVNGKVENQKTISLESNASDTITYKVKKSEAGNYLVQVGSKTGTFTVKASFFSSFEWWMWAAIGIIVIALIVMGALVLFLPKKKRPKTARSPSGPARITPPGIPVQPVPVQPIPGQPGQGQRMSPPNFAPQQMAPYSNQQQSSGTSQLRPDHSPGRPAQQYPAGQPPAQQYVPQQMPQFPNQSQPVPPRTTPQYPRPPQPSFEGMPPPPNQQMPVRPIPAQQPPPQHSQFPQSPHLDSQRPAVAPVFISPGQTGFPPKNPSTPISVIPQFAVTNFMISPRQVKDGDAVSISAVVTNKSTATFPYSMVLRIGGVVEEISEFTLNPGMSQTGLFTVIKDEPGDYYVEIDGQRGVFTVNKRLPPAFNISSLVITPDKVKQGDPVSISIIVSNTGETKGSYNVELTVKGVVESVEEIELEPGSSEKVTFNIVKDAAGFYPVAVEHLSGRFVVEMDWKG